MRECRVCRHPLPEAPLLRYSGMPKAAQFLPREAELATERGVDLEVFQCPGCGLVQLGCGPVPYYREVIRAAGCSEEMKAFRRRQFGDFVVRYGLTGRRLVEIGCGKGDFLSLLAEQSAEATGLEASQEAVEACLAQGLRVHQGFVEGPGWSMPGAPFDGFLFIQFLEHLPEPGAALRGIAANLAPGAVGLVEVPNFDMIVEQELFSEFIPDHLLYFTRESLTTTLALHGFEVLEIQEVWQRYILSAVVRKRPLLELGAFHARQAQLERELKAFAEAHPRLAVWGAGHQALAVLAVAGLGGRVKQGCFTPATHIPIVPPDRIATDPVDAVLIMAASYSDEVAGLVRARHGSCLTVAILREAGLELIP